MVLKKDTDLRILVDTIKDPRDLAELVHLSIATNRTLDITGKSIRHDHPKVSGIISSWFPEFKSSSPSININYTDDFFDKVKALKKAGYTIVGTSPNFGQSIFKTDFSKGKYVIVFGTEVGGLSKAKIAALDNIVSVPMLNQTKFYTLHTVIPVVVHEILRQKGFFGRGVIHGSKNKTNRNK
ncbi:MAG: TrmH family RNA methyltransferase [Candidatus ainarchaeum sp.]|nr:TrmH family RNA methyltransferase [Candidatus ainarchaeum sp.]